MKTAEICDSIYIQKDELQNEQIDKEEMLKNENAQMHAKRRDRHDYSRGARKQNGPIAQLDQHAVGRNNGEDEFRSVVLNQPDSWFPFIAEKDWSERILK